MMQVERDTYLNTLSSQIIGAAIEVHRQLGPGLLESAYEVCLAYELKQRKIACERQVTIPVIYKDITLDAGFRVDIIVDDLIVLELKSVNTLAAIHEAQLITYLKLTGFPLGLLLNFNVRLMRDGIKRIILT